ncbi:hypothetical protein SDC9_73372 [bioreactor metagenome]|uniref:Uncharacterized protein n=1 Tax=bioreactor metagenome TaxID=1076179 RepID=A0A644YF52_9ZZZZ
MNMHNFIVSAETFQGFLVVSGCCHCQFEDFRNGCSHRAFVADIHAVQVVSHQAALTVRWPSQWHNCRAAVDEVGHFDDVPYRKDIRIGCLQLVVHDDCAPEACLEIRLDCQFVFWRHADG